MTFWHLEEKKACLLLERKGLCGDTLSKAFSMEQGTRHECPRDGTRKEWHVEMKQCNTNSKNYYSNISSPNCSETNSSSAKELCDTDNNSVCLYK